MKAPRKHLGRDEDALGASGSGREAPSISGATIMLSKLSLARSTSCRAVHRIIGPRRARAGRPDPCDDQRAGDDRPRLFSLIGLSSWEWLVTVAMDRNARSRIARPRRAPRFRGRHGRQETAAHARLPLLPWPPPCGPDHGRQQWPISLRWTRERRARARSFSTPTASHTPSRRGRSARSTRRRAGWSRTRARSGRPKALWPRRRSPSPGSARATWPPSASRTSERRRSSGTGTAGSPCATPSSGRTGGPRRPVISSDGTAGRP